MSNTTKHIVLIICGSISAYKALDVIRGLKKRSYSVTAIITKGGQEFVTPLSIAALSESPVYSDLFSLKDETEMGHIRLSREADMIAVMPATADFIANVAIGKADDLALAVLLATDAKTTPIMIAPAMNPVMWNHPATQRNVQQLQDDGVTVIMPEYGEMACGEMGRGRLPEPESLVDDIDNTLRMTQALAGKKVVITAGPTYEPIDAVRYIANHSSGKQAIAIAKNLQKHGADVHLVHGNISEAVPSGVHSHLISNADSMLQMVEQLLPADIAICAAAVADWCVESPSLKKVKKEKDIDALTLTLKKTPDILKHISTHKTQRPDLVIGFAAETDDVQAYAQAKLLNKKCDWILANDVSNGAVFGKDTTHLLHLTKDDISDWGACSKSDAAQRLGNAIIKFFNVDI